MALAPPRPWCPQRWTPWCCIGNGLFRTGIGGLKMLQETNGPQQYAALESSVALQQHPDGSLSEHRLSDQEQADSFVAPLVLVLTPNGGEVLTVGQSVTILWKSASRVGLVAHQVKLS